MHSVFYKYIINNQFFIGTVHDLNQRNGIIQDVQVMLFLVLVKSKWHSCHLSGVPGNGVLGSLLRQRLSVPFNGQKPLTTEPYIAAI